MLPEITLIAGTAVDWSRFVTTVNNALGRSPTRELDRCSLPVGTPTSYVASLAEFVKAGSNPLTAVRDSDRVLVHLNFTFFVSLDPPTAMAVLKQCVGISVLAAEPSRGREHFLMTGSLRDWRTAVVEGCSPAGSVEARAFYNAAWTVFDRLGFREAFHRYLRKDMDDNTFMLEERRR